MRLFRLLPLYIALALGANTVSAADIATLESLREGDMKKLVFLSEPQAVPDAEFVLEGDAGTATLADFRGKYVLLNFWATWCAPCRKEMPMLSQLQDEFGGDQFTVLTLATGRNSPGAIDKFFTEAGISNLPRHADPKQALAREMGVLGLPITVILNPEGAEIARLRGDATWNSNSAKAIITALLDSANDT